MKSIHKESNSMADSSAFQPLPSYMAMEVAGDDRPLIRRMAREERSALSLLARREQTFSILWERHGTDSDDDRDLAWTWFNRWPAVSAALAKTGGVLLTPAAAADLVENIDAEDYT